MEQDEVDQLRSASWVVVQRAFTADLVTQMAGLPLGPAVVVLRTDSDRKQRDALLERIPADSEFTGRAIVFFQPGEDTEFEVLWPMAVFSISSGDKLVELFTRSHCSSCGRPVLELPGTAQRRPCPLCGSLDRVETPPAVSGLSGQKAAWYELPVSGPPARVDHAMCSDPLGGVILFGGGASTYMADAWRLRNGHWEQLGGEAPPPRAQHRMAFDPGRKLALLFGGGAAESYLGDMWAWDGTDWQELAAVGPNARAQFAMAFDSNRGRLVLFGGVSQAGPQTDTWEWDGEWHRIPTDVSPSGFYGPGMAYDPVRRLTVLFGGNGPGGHSPITWEWDGTSWTAQAREPKPPARASLAMAFSRSLGGVVLHGGSGDAGALADTWLLTENGWQEIEPATSPDERQDHAMAEDREDGSAALFGGQWNGLRNDTWVLGRAERTAVLATRTKAT